MQILSVNVGRPRTVEWRGKESRTAFDKQPVLFPALLSADQLEGDAQADRRVHGGPDKAVYAYPSEHTDFWRRTLERDELPPGSFGENFTTAGLLETEVHLGDRYRFGEAEVEVAQPRFPCIKMAMRFRRDDVPHLFRRSGRSGFYLRVKANGRVGSGDPIELLHRPDHGFTVHRLVRTFFSKQPDFVEIEQAVALPGLPDDWKTPLERRLRLRR